MMKQFIFARSRLAAVAAGVALLLLGSTAPVYAAGATLYVRPSSATVVNGSTLAVAVRVNTNGGKADGVQANLTYPASQLDFLSIDTSGSQFEIRAPSSGRSGKVSIACATLSNGAGDKLVATVYFRAKVSSGTGSISFASGSAVTDSGNNVLGGTSGGKYTFAPVPVAVAPPVTTGGNTHPSPSPKPAPKPVDKTPPVISKVAAQPTASGAVITWQTNEPATSSVDYGPATSYGFNVQNKQAVTSHSITIASDNLHGGMVVHYRISSVDKSGNAAKTADSTFTTQNYAVIIHVGNTAGVANITVKLGSQEAVTDKAGDAHFSNVPAGSYTVKVNGIPHTVVVQPSSGSAANKPQTFTISYMNTGAYVGGVVAVLVLLLLFVFVHHLHIVSRWRTWRAQRHIPHGAIAAGGGPMETAAPQGPAPSNVVGSVVAPGSSLVVAPVASTAPTPQPVAVQPSSSSGVPLPPATPPGSSGTPLPAGTTITPKTPPPASYPYAEP